MSTHKSPSPVAMSSQGARTRVGLRWLCRVLTLMVVTAVTAAEEDSPTPKSTTALDQRVPTFRVRNAPLNQFINALNSLPVRVCAEYLPPPTGITYIDEEANLVFSEPVYSLEATDTTVRELLDRIVAMVPGYQWELVEVVPAIVEKLAAPVSGSTLPESRKTLFHRSNRHEEELPEVEVV